MFSLGTFRENGAVNKSKKLRISRVKYKNNSFLTKRRPLRRRYLSLLILLCCLTRQVESTTRILNWSTDNFPERQLVGHVWWIVMRIYARCRGIIKTLNWRDSKRSILSLRACYVPLIIITASRCPDFKIYVVYNFYLNKRFNHRFRMIKKAGIHLSRFG